MRRITEQLQAVASSWRGLPVTLGLLVAIIGAAVAVVQALGSINERIDRTVEKAISQHDLSVKAHMHIQQRGEGACNELRGRIRSLESRMSDIRSRKRGRR